MKIWKFCFNFCLTLLLVLGGANPGLVQTGNQSDGTNPNTIQTPPVSEPAQTPTSSAGERTIDKPAYTNIVTQSSPPVAVQAFEEAQAVQFGDQLNTPMYGKTPTIDEISVALYKLWQATNKKAVITYVFSQENELQTLTVFPLPPNSAANPNNNLVAAADIKNGTLAQTQRKESSVRKSVPEANRENLTKVLKDFRNEISNPRKIDTTSYLKSAQQLYQWIIAPIEPDLQADQVDTIVFAMDSGLRSTPISALHDGKQFLVEKYAVGLIPSFGLTDSRYFNLKNSPVLAMGSSKFSDQAALPAVPFELSNIFSVWKGEKALNEQFTLDNFIKLNQQKNYRVIHLATHGEFQPGDLKNSYIQFWNTKLRMDELRNVADKLGWNVSNLQPVELMVLSACRTALGDEQAELGFAGLAVQAGVKSALASLWYVSDTGTLALMNEFYKQLNLTGNKAQALRQAQLAMIKGQVRVEAGQLRGSDQQALVLPPQVETTAVNLSHPYFWSAFTLIGNWN